MSKKKLSTQEILAAARAQAGKEAGQPAATPPAETPADSGSQKPDAGSNGDTSNGDGGVQESGAAPEPSKAPAATPKSTKDILAAARAQAAGKTSESAAAPKPAATKPAAAGTPKSTKDILAAARAQATGGGTTASATKPKPATAKPAAKTAPAAKADGAKPSVQEMLRAVREGKKPGAAAAAPTAPKTPKKPLPAARPVAKKDDTTRRGFLVAAVAAVCTPFVIAWTSLAAASLGALLGVARFMFPNVLVEPPSQFKIGPPSDYPFGTVSTKWTAQYAVWVVHTSYQGKSLIYALSTVCTHLGCTPNWLDGEQKFKCPCHGSGFYITGVNFEGPAPRPLERVGIRLAPDGMLEVDKSMKFQQELGEWQDANSFVEIV